MTEYLFQEETLTALADEVRELSGITDKMNIGAMTSNLGEANAEVDNQADLIAQIKDMVDNLPEAGKGGGGNQNAGEWIPLSSLPTTYAADPVGATYYLPIQENVVGFIVMRNDTNFYAGYMLLDGSVNYGTPNLASCWIATDESERYLAMTLNSWDNASNFFVLPIYEYQG